MQTIDISSVTLSQRANVLTFSFANGSALTARQVRSVGRDGINEISKWMRILQRRQRAARAFHILSRYIKPHPVSFNEKRNRVKRAMLAYARLVRKHVAAAAAKAGVAPDGTPLRVTLQPAREAGTPLQANGLPEGWSEEVDEGSDGVFFWHDATGTSFWSLHEVREWDQTQHPASDAITAPLNGAAAAAAGAQTLSLPTVPYPIRLPASLDAGTVAKIRALELENAMLIDIMRTASTQFGALVGSATAAGVHQTIERTTRVSLTGQWVPPSAASALPADHNGLYGYTGASVASTSAGAGGMPGSPGPVAQAMAEIAPSKATDQRGALAAFLSFFLLLL